MRIPITFPFDDPPAQEKRDKEERERREMRFGEKASGEMREEFSSPRTNPVPISRLYSLEIKIHLFLSTRIIIVKQRVSDQGRLLLPHIPDKLIENLC